MRVDRRDPQLGWASFCRQCPPALDRLPSGFGMAEKRGPVPGSELPGYYRDVPFGTSANGQVVLEEADISSVKRNEPLSVVLRDLVFFMSPRVGRDLMVAWVRAGGWSGAFGKAGRAGLLL